MTVTVFLAALLGAMAMGMPIAFALLVCAYALQAMQANFDLTIVAQKLIEGADNYPLLAIPFFVLACCVLVVWGTARQHDIISSTRSLVMGFPMSLMYGVAYVCGTGIGLISLARIVQLLREGPASGQLEPASAAAEVAKEAVA